MTLPRILGKICLFFALGAILLICVYLSLARYDDHYVASHSSAQNLIYLGATDACAMYSLAQIGNLKDATRHMRVPVMTIYLSAPARRRPKTGDVLEIKFPRELAGKIRFTQATNTGYGGSGSLEWIGRKRNVQLGMTIWDFTSSGSLQYQLGNVQLWGDCKKKHELKG